MKDNNLILAENEFSKALLVSKNNVEIYFFRAEARFKLGKYLLVISDLDRYIEIYPKDATSYMLRGLAKSLLSPEDIVGTCEDILKAKNLGMDIRKLNGIKDYCKNQEGW